MVMDNGGDTQEWEETQDGATAGPRDGCSDTMHIACSTGSLFVPLPADLATANISDNSMHESITALTRKVMHWGDEGYDDHKLCDFGRYRANILFLEIGMKFEGQFCFNDVM